MVVGTLIVHLAYDTTRVVVSAEIAVNSKRVAQVEQEKDHYTEVRIRSESLTEIQPAEYRADLVMLLLAGKPVLGIVVEVQLTADERKRFAWPVYAVGLRARIKCPVCLFVVSHSDAVARWRARPIDLGGGNHFTPLVLGPAGVPVVTNPAQAKADPEVAVLSAMSHGHGHPESSAQIAAATMAASAGLDADRSRLCVDLVFASLSRAARKALQAMDPAKYEYQSDFAKRYVARRSRSALRVVTTGCGASQHTPTAANTANYYLASGLRILPGTPRSTQKLRRALAALP
jgi:hypothetical protein